jgi:hypothetical protein
MAHGASTALEGAHIIKSSAGILSNLYIAGSLSSGYLMVFNSATVPADGAVTPVISLNLAITGPAPGVFNGINFDNYPAYFSNGIVAVYSTTGPYTKTEAADAYFNWDAE